MAWASASVEVIEAVCSWDAWGTLWINEEQDPKACAAKALDLAMYRMYVVRAILEAAHGHIPCFHNKLKARL